MVRMGVKRWPESVAVLTAALLPDGNVVNLLARDGEHIIYVTAVYPSPSEAPILNYGRVPPAALAPLTATPERTGSHP